jgi:RNA polymerase primary sigma factor
MRRNTSKRAVKTNPAAPSPPATTLPDGLEAAEGARRDLHWDDEPAEHLESADPEDAEEEAAASEEGGAAAAEGEEGDPHAPDDALGLYLRQMGAIPLLSREQELALAERLEYRRRRYRRAALSSWRTLSLVVATFEKVRAGQLALDPTIDVVTTLGLSRERILQRMPHNLGTLRRLIDSADADFRALLRASTAAARNRLRRLLWRRLQKSIKLAEELSPRIDLLERWSEDLRVLSHQMSDLAHRIDSGDRRSAAERERRTKMVKQLRDLMLQVRASPEDLAKLARVY